MNVGQILETHLGWACKEFGEEVKKLVNENNKKFEKTEKISSFLKSVYGNEVFDGGIDKLNKTEFRDLCENLQNGIAISTPVFDGAKEKDVSEMLELANSSISETSFSFAPSKTGVEMAIPFCKFSHKSLNSVLFNLSIPPSNTSLP